MAQFERQVQAFVNLAKNRTDNTVRQAVILLAQGVVMGNPVDTGRSRNGWNFGVASIPNVPTDLSATEFDRSGGVALARIIGQSSAFKAGEVGYMSNSVPYVPSLEFGPSVGGRFSKQAPVGWIRATVMDLPRRLDAYLAGLR